MTLPERKLRSDNGALGLFPRVFLYLAIKFREWTACKARPLCAASLWTEPVVTSIEIRTGTMKLTIQNFLNRRLERGRPSRGHLEWQKCSETLGGERARSMPCTVLIVPFLGSFCFNADIPMRL